MKQTIAMDLADELEILHKQYRQTGKQEKLLAWNDRLHKGRDVIFGYNPISGNPVYKFRIDGSALELGSGTDEQGFQHPVIKTGWPL